MEQSLQQNKEHKAPAPIVQADAAAQQPIHGQASANPPTIFPHKPSADISKAPETTGERYFRRLRFGVAEAFILVTTAGLAYLSAYKPTLFGRENKLFTWSRALEETMDQPWINKRLSGAFSNTMMTFHGGNLFAPVMYWFDHSKEKIVTYFNQRFGTPEEVEIGKERVSQEAKPTLWTVIKGRIVAFAIVFSAFVGADFLLGKNKQGNYRFDAFTDRIGRVIGHWAEKDAPLLSKERLFNQGPASVPFGAPGSDIPAAYKGFFESFSYRIGKILSLDVFATTSAILIWTVSNKLFAEWDAKKLSHATAPAAGFSGSAMSPKEGEASKPVASSEEASPDALPKSAQKPLVAKSAPRLSEGYQAMLQDSSRAMALEM